MGEAACGVKAQEAGRLAWYATIANASRGLEDGVALWDDDGDCECGVCVGVWGYATALLLLLLLCSPDPSPTQSNFGTVRSPPCGTRGCSRRWGCCPREVGAGAQLLQVTACVVGASQSDASADERGAHLESAFIALQCNRDGPHLYLHPPHSAPPIPQQHHL